MRRRKQGGLGERSEKGGQQGKVNKDSEQEREKFTEKSHKG